MSNTRWIIEREEQSIILVTEELAKGRGHKSKKTLPRELVRLVCQNLAAVTNICEAVMLRSEKEIETPVQKETAVWLKSGLIKRMTGRRRCVVFFAPPAELLYASEEEGEWPGDFLLIAPGDMKRLSAALNRFSLKDYVEYYDAVCRLSLATVALYDDAELVINAPSDEWLATALSGIETIEGCVGGHEILHKLLQSVSAVQEQAQEEMNGEAETEADIAKRVAQLFSDPEFTTHPSEPPRAWYDLLSQEDAQKQKDEPAPPQDEPALEQSEPEAQEPPAPASQEPEPQAQSEKSGQ
ncbi:MULTISPECIES: hypothetical protein [unclassified Clostridium]|nr:MULTISPECIES: hypothetical protein [unclassified Clostridium]